MKKIFIVVLCFCFLVSCNKKEEVKNEQEIDWYTKTLESTLDDAKEVKALMEKNNEKLKNNLLNK